MKCFKCYKAIKGKHSYGLHTSCFIEWFKVANGGGFSNLDIKKPISSDSYLNIKKAKDSFYHGRYRKYSAKLAEVGYILKVQESQYPDLPATEYLCNRIATILNLSVPEHYLIRFKDEKAPNNKYNRVPKQPLINTAGRITFVTKNFMQDHIGTLNHIYKLLPKGSKNYNCQNIIKIINTQTGKLTDVEKFIKICLFDAFIGNNDRHGRNLGIIDKGKSKILAPMYDNPSYFGTIDNELLLHHWDISGFIWTSNSKKPKLLDYINEFTKLNFNKPCHTFIKKIIKQFPLLEEEVKKSFISNKRKKAFIKFLKDRLKDCQKLLKEGLKNV